MNGPAREAVVDIELDEPVKIDLQRLEYVVWDRCSPVDECRVCSLDDETFIELHNDALNLGSGSSEFYSIWSARMGGENLRNHFRHHYIESKITRQIQKSRARYESGRNSHMMRSLTDRDRIVIEKAVNGEFGPMYAEVIGSMFAHHREIEKRFDETRKLRDELENDDVEPDSPEAKANEMKILAAIEREEELLGNSYSMLEKLGKQITEVDKRYHDRSRELVQTYIEWVKTSMLEKVLFETRDALDAMVTVMAAAVGEDRAREVVQEQMGRLRQRVESITRHYLDESKKQVKTIGGKT